MQLTSQKPAKQQFRPFGVSITFDSIEEAEMLKNMLRFNVTIPQIVMGLKEEDADEMAMMMTRIRFAIEESEKE